MKVDLYEKWWMWLSVGLIVFFTAAIVFITVAGAVVPPSHIETIDPTTLAGEEIHRIRTEEMRRLIIYKLTRHPMQSFRLLRRFFRYMPARDVIYLLIKPFLGKKSGATKAEVLSRAVEHREAKDAAADLTQMPHVDLAVLAEATASDAREARQQSSN